MRIIKKCEDKKYCICECTFCGKEKLLRTTNVKRTKSCGCTTWILLRNSKSKPKIFFDKWEYIEFELNRWWICKIDKEDFENIKVYSWYMSVRWYVEVRSNCKLLKLHRFLFDSKEIEWKVIDHINHDPLDNRRVNLRICTNSQNLMNSWPKTWKYKWVYFDKRANKYVARILWKYIWAFFHEKDAAIAYDIEAKKQYWEFAYLNIL